MRRGRLLIEILGYLGVSARRGSDVVRRAVDKDEHLQHALFHVGFVIQLAGKLGSLISERVY